MRGRAAADALGSRLAAVAARNDLSGARLQRLLSEDRTAWLSREGQLYYQEEIPEEAVGTGTGTAPEAAYSTTETFALHSRPGATRKIFLDFDGASISNTGWNVGSNAISNGTHIGWDSDGSPGSFSTTEHDWIQEVWRQVAETYAPFDVDVTTDDPGPDGWTRSTSSDTSYGTRVVVTSSQTALDQACGSCLGVAWVGTFNMVDPNRYYQPAWVFAANPNLKPMIVAQAASHEAGHTLGLHHDGTQSASYYGGTAAWGPIMGSARSRAISQFSRGEYAGANNTEDDFAVMQGKGLPLRTDDHGSSTSTATALGARPSYDVSGVVSTRTDTDLVAIDVDCPTDLVVAANGIGSQTTLNLSLDVLDAAGNTVASSSPISGYAGSQPVSTGMDAQVTLPAAEGTYYLRVDGVGQGAPSTTVWSDYGSVGQWRLTANGCASSPPPEPETPEEPPVPPAPTPTPTPTPTLTRPGAPVIRAGSWGLKGGVSSALARWWAPTVTGGTPATKYRVRAQRRDSANRVIANKYSSYLSPNARSATMRLARGRYTFAVMTWNKVGPSVVVAVLQHGLGPLTFSRRLTPRAAPAPCVRRPGRRSATSAAGSPAGRCRSAP